MAESPDRNRTWDEWQNLLTQIPDGAITGDMIQQLTIPADRLEDIYPALHYADEIGGEGDINDWSNGIYIGTLTENWRARYGVSGHYILIADGMQIMYIPEANRVQFRERGHMGRWDSWEVIDLCSYAVVHREVHGESGYISENYAWYTDPSQGLSLSGTYTLVGDFCTINGTVPLIEGWETVYYSLPCNSLFSACRATVCFPHVPLRDAAMMCLRSPPTRWTMCPSSRSKRSAAVLCRPAPLASH